MDAPSYGVASMAILSEEYGDGLIGTIPDHRIGTASRSLIALERKRGSQGEWDFEGHEMLCYFGESGRR